nr:RNA-binding domain-containing protein [Novosphingobium marinum]
MVENLRSLPHETDWVEFKHNYENEEGIGKYISALCNAAILNEKDDAYLVWGIEDETHKVVGTNVDVRKKKKGNSPFLFWLSRELDPSPTLHVETVEYEGMRVELLCIRPPYERPVRFKGQAYVRVGTAQQRLSDHPELERSIWQITSRFSFEESIIEPNATLENLDEKYDYTKLLNVLGVRTSSKEARITKLESEGLIKINLQGRYDIKSLLAISCASDLNEFSALRSRGARVISFDGADKGHAADDIEGKRGYAVVFENLLKVMMSRLTLGEYFEGGKRRNHYAIPEETIREFAANAIVHQDFTKQGERPTFEVYSDRVRIINPGVPLIEADRFIDSPSRSRNPSFAGLMRKAGLCELRGSGVDRAVRAIERMALPPPLIQPVEGSTIVTVFKDRPFAKLTPEERVRACYQHACLKYEGGEAMSNSSLRERFGLSKRQYPQISNVIRDSIEAKKIVPENEDQGKRYARYLPYWAR